MSTKKGSMRVLLSIYKERPDLQAAFPEVKQGDFKRLLGWAITCGVTIDSAKNTLDPILAHLTELVKPLRYAEENLLKNIIIDLYGSDFVFNIDERDEMYQYSANHPSSTIDNPAIEYLKIGEIIVECLKEVIEDTGYKCDQINSFLDFACGYGRSIRFLIYTIPKDKITVSDIDKGAVDFCRKTFGVKGFYSVMDPNSLKHEGKYDVIYVVSLFTHLVQPLWEAWFKRLYDMLNDKGVLIFSAHGAAVYEQCNEEGKRQFIQSSRGFLYNRISETARLSVDHYGTTIVYPEYVVNFIYQNNCGKLLGFYPKKLNNHHDIYAVMKC